MNQQPDKLFRDKLQGYQQPVPARSWNRVSQNLGGKHQGKFWLRIAATVLVIIASGIFLYPVLRKEAGQSISHNTGTPPSNQSEQPKSDTTEPAPPINPERARPEEKKQTADAASTGRRHGRALPETPKKDATSETNAEHVRVENRIAPSIVRNEEPAVTSEESNIDVAIESANEPLITSSNAESVTIVFSAEEVNQKYLTKRPDADATPEAKETSGLKRLLDKASDMKNNQDLLGELRQKKNEILAMNFRNDKQNTEND